MFVLATASTAGAQDYDELFAQTDNETFAFFDQVGAADPMIPAETDEEPAEFESLPAPASVPSSETAQSRQAARRAVESPSDLRLTDRSGSRAVQQPSKAMRIRQARALAEMRAITARLEAERWGLLPSLRPTWSAGLMTTSGSPADITYIVPVYVRDR